MNEKDNLYNAIVDDMTKSNVKFPSYKADNKVEKYTRVLVNALWYLDGKKDKFKHQKVEKLPDRFLNQFNNYNDWKRKKIAAPRIESVVLKEQAIIGDDPELVNDLRHLNKGRPGDMFQVFFDALEKKVEAMAAADERSCSHV